MPFTPIVTARPLFNVVINYKFNTCIILLVSYHAIVRDPPTLTFSLLVHNYCRLPRGYYTTIKDHGEKHNTWTI